MLEKAHLACLTVSTQYATTSIGGVFWISRLFLSKLETWLMSKLVRPSLGQPGYIQGTSMP
jgi:hypothetical protein